MRVSPLATAFTALLDLLAPPRCPGCDYPRTGPVPFCEACAPLLEPAPAADAARGVWRYQGPLADAVQRLKYRGRTDLAADLGAALWLGLAPEAPTVDVVTAVPLHPRRLRVRGYNQSVLLAAPVSRALGARLRPQLLRRVRDTPSQVGTDRRRRADQVRGAFAAHPRVAGLRVLVVDDVRTSGATLAEAVRTLHAAGAREVHAVALAQAEQGGTTAP